jgi:Kdo2-lipid IVA lauroyltransferase/acyltransferase
MARKRGQRAQDLIWRLEALGFDVATAFVRLLPVDVASDLGAVLMRWIGPLTSVQKTVDRNLRIAFPGMPAAERKRISIAQWGNFGRYCFEMALMDRLTPSSGRVEVVGAERLAEIARGEEGAVYVSGHFANFEVMAAVLMEAGVKCQVTYRATNNPYFDQRIIESRRNYGISMFAPKGEAAALRGLYAALKRDEAVAILSDQKFNEGITDLFFGQPAQSATGAIRLVLRTGARLQLGYVERLKSARFRAVVCEPIYLQNTDDPAADLAHGVRLINAFLEERIRARPEDWWFWVHRRWPDEVYAALGD